jgi:hypothetical protein
MYLDEKYLDKAAFVVGESYFKKNYLVQVV